MQKQQKRGLRWLFRGVSCAVILYSLSACYALQPEKHNTPEVVMSADEIQAFAEYLDDFFWRCFVPGYACVENVSFPFYFDDEPVNQQVFAHEISGRKDQGNVKRPDNLQMRYQLLDVSTLHVFWPDIWDKLSARTDFQDEKDRLKLAVVTFIFEGHHETAWLLLRHEDQQWKVAGYIDG